jgi:septum formation protein
VYLASKSPQRKALLEALGIDFTIVPPDYDEVDGVEEEPAELVERHSRGKALSVLPKLPPLSMKRPVLAVDTMVVIDGSAVGKAADQAQAKEFIRRMSGGEHEVYSGISLLSAAPGGVAEPGEDTRHAVTRVRFAEIPAAEVDHYVATGEWRERAGAYAIQGRASAFVEGISGDYTNVVGLPVPLLVAMLRDIGLWPVPEATS